MDVAVLAKSLAENPLPTVCAVLCSVVLGLYLALLLAHRREMALAMRVVVLAERLVPLVAKAQRKTGAHPVVEVAHAEE